MYIHVPTHEHILNRCRRTTKPHPAHHGWRLLQDLGVHISMALPSGFWMSQRKCKSHHPSFMLLGGGQTLRGGVRRGQRSLGVCPWRGQRSHSPSSPVFSFPGLLVMPLPDTSMLRSASFLRPWTESNTGSERKPRGPASQAGLRLVLQPRVNSNPWSCSETLPSAEFQVCATLSSLMLAFVLKFVYHGVCA